MKEQGQYKLFEIIPDAVKEIPVRNETAKYWIQKIKQDLEETRRKYEQGKLYEYQKRKINGIHES